jgi:signal transduction histidine kinase
MAYAHQAFASALAFARHRVQPAIFVSKVSAEMAEDKRPHTGWSLKRKIRVLGVLLAATIALAAGLAIEFARHTEGATINDARHRLVSAALKLRDRYESAASSEPSGGIRITLSHSDENALRALVSSVLASVPGAEGGFYDARTGALVGYAYPTYQGSGPKTDVPAAERSSILKVAQAAANAGGGAELRVEAGPDVILFYALALKRNGQPADAVWVMHRMVGVKSSYGRLQPLSLGLLVIACALATGVAWGVTRRLDRGVATIENALHEMAVRLDTPVNQTGIGELDRIGAAVSRLAEALDQNQKRRDELEQRLRHADRLAALGRLVAAVAHEVRNPLASIKLKLALAKKLPEDQQRLASTFEVIRSEVDRIDRIVGRLLDLGKATKANMTSTDLRGFLAERVRTYEPRAQSRGVRIELAIASSVEASVTIDRDRLGQIVDNLIINALDAAPAGRGRVLIEVERTKPQRLVIRVIDNGPGIPPQLRERIFEPFVTGKPGGTGLGLFISAQLARAMGGELLDSSEPPHAGQFASAEDSAHSGAKFELVLPC